jgi:transposase-like protein
VGVEANPNLPKERYAMTENRVVVLRQTGEIDDPLTEILRAGAKRLIAQAVEAEFSAFLGLHEDKALPDGRQRVVRHGHEPAREIQTGIGPVEVKKPKARDRGGAADGERIRYSSTILPLWARRTKSLDALLPALYLRGVSSGDFQEALAALLGKNAANLSPSVVSRLKEEWRDEYEGWRKRDLSARRYVYLWADGVYLQARMEPQAECMLVLIGATPEGKKELVGFHAGYRESAQSWKELLVDLKARGLALAPELAIGDGALGFWKALDEAFPTTRHQRCWLHKTLNVLDKLPKSLQSSAHRDLREIWLSPSRAAAETAMAAFSEKFTAKYSDAVKCLLKDRDALLTFFDFPAEHWTHLRTTNPIESVFSTVRHRTVRMKGALSQETAKTMVFKLIMAASKNWRRLQGQNQLTKIVTGVQFSNGIEIASQAKSAA